MLKKNITTIAYTNKCAFYMQFLFLLKYSNVAYQWNDNIEFNTIYKFATIENCPNFQPHQKKKVIEKCLQPSV